MVVGMGDFIRMRKFQMKVVCQNCKNGLLCGANYRVVCRLDGFKRHPWDTCEKGEYEDE